MLFGCHVYNYGPASDVQTIQQIGRKAEELGLASVWVSDHIVIPDSAASRFGDTFFDPFITLSYLAGATSSVRLGTSVLVLPYRNPLETAKMVSSLDALSGGRMILGVGLGGLEAEFAVLKQPFHERGRQSDEYIRIMKEVWTSPEPSYHGEYWQFDHIKVDPRPVQQPHPPLIIGGASRAALRRVARLGDGWLPNRLSPEQIKADWQIVKDLAQRRGRDPSALQIHLRQPMVFQDRPARPHVPFFGTPQEMAGDIRNYHQAGVSQIIFDFHYIGDGSAHQSYQSALNALERFNTEVRPLVPDLEG